MKKALNTKQLLENQQGSHFVLITESIIVGMLAGIVIVCFRKGIEFFYSFMSSFYNKIKLNSQTKIMPLTP